MILAEKVMTLRKKKGWSQEELAEKLNISRQSVSKWESGASIPDIDKIILISGLFGVSTDYLLKDEMETEEISEKEIQCEESDAKCVSVEEADSFMRLKRKLAVPTALGTALCILSPIPLLLLGGLTEYGSFGVTEDMAGGFGVTILLIILAIGVGILVHGEMRLLKYEYIEKENLTLQYGVRGIVERNRDGFARTAGLAMTAGTVLCILGVVPLMVAQLFLRRTWCMSYVWQCCWGWWPRQLFCLYGPEVSRAVSTCCFRRGIIQRRKSGPERGWPFFREPTGVQWWRCSLPWA